MNARTHARAHSNSHTHAHTHTHTHTHTYKHTHTHAHTNTQRRLRVHVQKLTPANRRQSITRAFWLTDCKVTAVTEKLTALYC